MKKLIITGIAAAIVGVLAFFAAVTVTFVPGVAAVYPASAFEAAFGSWFGIWGAIASFVGLLVAGAMGGWFALPVGVLLSLSDFVLALAPMIAIRAFGLDPVLPNWKHMLGFVLVSLFFGSVPGSLWYNFINLQLGVLAGWNSYWIAVLGWNVGNLLVLSIIGIPLLRFGTPIIKRTDLFVRGLF